MLSEDFSIKCLLGDFDSVQTNQYDNTNRESPSVTASLSAHSSSSLTVTLDVDVSDSLSKFMR